jgi:inner membrane transporter RhtA
MNRSSLAVLSIVSVQLGAAVATSLFDRVGASGTVFLRQGVAALVLLVVTRPRVGGRTVGDWLVVAALGVVLAVMNLSFYAAVDRLPLGIAVTIELLGPLGLAAALSRSARQASCVAVAVVGVAILGLGSTGDHLDPVGIVCATSAAVGWASYIVLSRQLGRHFPNTDGLAFAMTVAALVTVPVAIPTAGAQLVEPRVLGIGFAVAMLSAAIPFSLELHALRTVDARTFGVIMSTSPAVAALIGLLVLDQRLGALQIVGMACVVTASAAMARAARSTRRSRRSISAETADVVVAQA